MDRDDERYAGRLRVYKDLDENRIPLSESLKDTVDRFLPYYQQEIEPQVRAGKQVLISNKWDIDAALEALER